MNPASPSPCHAVVDPRALTKAGPLEPDMFIPRPPGTQANDSPPGGPRQRGCHPPRLPPEARSRPGPSAGRGDAHLAKPITSLPPPRWHTPRSSVSSSIPSQHPGRAFPAPREKYPLPRMKDRRSSQCQRAPQPRAGLLVSTAGGGGHQPAIGSRLGSASRHGGPHLQLPAYQSTLG